MTRLASGDPQIWLDIFTTNRDAMIQAIDVFGQALARFRGVLSESHDQALMDLLCQTKETRDTWIKRCGPK